jgi:hypothetical protein
LKAESIRDEKNQLKQDVKEKENIEVADAALRKELAMQHDKNLFQICF